MKILFYCSVGNECEQVLEDNIKVFKDVGAEILLRSYTDLNFDVTESYTTTIGSKLYWAYKLLKDKDFDYLFCWDCDFIPIKFDPLDFVDIMRRNNLDIAQPAYTRDSSYCWDINRHDENTVNRGYSGRYTNFVETSYPVYSKKAWDIVFNIMNEYDRNTTMNDYMSLPYLLGRDFIQVGNQGIIDSQLIKHFKPIAKKDRTMIDYERSVFYNMTGVKQYTPQTQGYFK